jgi:hypothetical protein
VKWNPDGTIYHHYAVSYTLYTFDGEHQYVMLPPDGPGAAPVDIYDPGDNCEHHFRMEFLPAPGGGTVVALYGYQVVPHDGIVGKFLKAAPTLEYGLALIPQMTMVLAMAARAEQLTAHKPPPPTGAPGSYQFLLDRGTVALLRRAGGRLVDFSLVERSRARPEVLAHTFSDPGTWSQFVPTIARSSLLDHKDALSLVELEQSLPLISFTTGFAFKTGERAADLFGVSGDLSDARLRFDVTPRGSDSELVLRAILHYDKGSVVIRQLYKLEPFFELGIDVGLGLLFIDGVEKRAASLSERRGMR